MTLPLPLEDSSSSNFELPPPPDLLRRFVPLPYHGSWFVDGVTFNVETNREELLRSFPAGTSWSSNDAVTVKVVVDSDIPPRDGRASLIVDSGQVCWGHLAGTLFTFDRGSGEMFLFVPEPRLHAFEAIFEELLRQTEPVPYDTEQPSFL